MLTDADRLLIAAGVDGPLPSEQAGQLARLLAASAEARVLAAALAADRQRLAGLPSLAAPFGFTEAIDAALPIVRPSTPQPAHRRPSWLPYVAAAAIFAAIAVGTYRLTARIDRSSPAIATAPPVPPRLPESHQAKRVELLPLPRPVDEPPAVADRVVPVPTELAPAPRPVTAPTLFAAGLFREIEPPAEVTSRLPLLGPVSDLDSADYQTRAAAMWATLPAARIDLFAPDPASALPAVQAVAKTCGWVVATDPGVTAVHKSKQPGTFALYLDAVPADNGGRFLAGLAAQQRGGGKLGSVHLSAAGSADLRELRDLFGGDVKPTARATKSDSTIGQVLKQLTPRRPALLYAISPSIARPAAGSKEVRAFADGRSERKPGNIPLLIVVRAAD